MKQISTYSLWSHITTRMKSSNDENMVMMKLSWEHLGQVVTDVMIRRKHLESGNYIYTVATRDIEVINTYWRLKSQLETTEEQLERVACIRLWLCPPTPPRTPQSRRTSRWRMTYWMMATRWWSKITERSTSYTNFIVILVASCVYDHYAFTLCSTIQAR